MKAASYRPCHCKEDCFALDLHENEPCWGEVVAIDEMCSGDDYYFIHSCQGHKDKYEGGEYIPERWS